MNLSEQVQTPFGKFEKYRLCFPALFGCMLLYFAIDFSRTTWTTKSSLIELKGTLRKSSTYISTVNSPRYGSDHYSQKADLIFRLNEHSKEFVLAENIGSSHIHGGQEEINRGLLRADSISVWIRKRELDERRPKVFQIETNLGTLLEFDTVRYEHRSVATFMGIFGVLLIGISGLLLFPKFFTDN